MAAGVRASAAATEAAVRDREAGNPLFATQLVGDWVEQERLMETTGGYDLIDDGSYALPDSIFGTWTARIEGVVDFFCPNTGSPPVRRPRDIREDRRRLRHVVPRWRVIFLQSFL